MSAAHDSVSGVGVRVWVCACWHKWCGGARVAVPVSMSGAGAKGAVLSTKGGAKGRDALTSTPNALASTPAGRGRSPVRRTS